MRARSTARSSARAAMKEETDAVKAAAMRERLASPLAMWFAPALERDVTRQKRLVEEYLDDVRERAQKRGWAALAHSKVCLPKGILASAAMQPYLLRWAAADGTAAVEAAPSS